MTVIKIKIGTPIKERIACGLLSIVKAEATGNTKINYTKEIFVP